MGTHTYGVCCYKSVITKRKDSPLWEWKRFITRLKKKLYDTCKIKDKKASMASSLLSDHLDIMVSRSYLGFV